MMRRTYRKSQVTVSLFPFLAVLICMMGALIVVLVLVVQQARVSAAVATDDGPTAEQLAEADELELARQDHQWRREILDQQRLEMTKQQANHRLELSHLEDHIRRLEEKWKLLQADAAILTTSAEADNRSVQSAAAELVQLRQAIGLAQQQLHEAREAAETRPRSYAIIPYRGMHGTLRRPIFIECTARGIVLQPEGLVITESDLNGPAGPGNPLDAALRATREYLVANGIVDLEGEPYPLLIVRPDGTEAYGAARNAMKTWDDEFGYELVEADVQLEYPTADPVLRELIIKTIADARQRQEILAAAMPSHSAARCSTPSMAASPSAAAVAMVAGETRVRSPSTKACSLGALPLSMSRMPSAVSAGPLTNASRQPWLPQPHRGPSGTRVWWPISPAAPSGPSRRWPSSTTPPPTPVPRPK